MSKILLALIFFLFSLSVAAKASAGKLPSTVPCKSLKSGTVRIVPPIIESFSPVRAVKGDTIIIIGKNFANVKSVQFGGSSATFQMLSSTRILAVVGDGATGSAVVGGDDGIDSLAGFTFISAPSISQVRTFGEGAGMQVVIEGKDFDEVKSVMFGDVPAYSFSVKSSTEITAVVGEGETGTISITTRAGTGKKTGFYFRKPPVVSIFEPVNAGAGSVLTIRGSNFNASAAKNKVYFGSISAEVISGGVDVLQVKVPANAPNECIRVLNSANKLSGFSRQVFRLTYDVEVGKSLYPNSTTLNFGQKISDILSADFDGDSYNDLAVFVPIAGFTILRHSQAPGIFEEDILSEKIQIPINEPEISYAIGDVSGDGLIDIVCVVPGKIIVLKNQSTSGNISFSKESSNVSIDASNKKLTIKDIDLDGKCDLFINNLFSRNISNFNTENVVSFSSFKELSSRFHPNLGAGEVEDLDGDNKPDFLANGYYALVLQKNNLAVGDTSDASYANPLTINAQFYDGKGISAVDLDGDNLPEIIQHGGIGVNIFRNQYSTSSGNFSFAAPYLPENAYIQTDKPIFADINGDAKPDIVSRGAEGFHTNLNLGKSLTNRQQFDIGINYGNDVLSSVTMADLDGNGKPEIIAAGANTNVINIFHNSPGSKPVITSFFPDSAGFGQVVKITGFNLSKVSQVKFGDNPASSFQVHSSGLITATVGSGASGKVSLLSESDLAAKDGFVFVPPPVITAVSPSTALAGTEVSIYGANFKNTTLVTFGGVKADSIKVISPTSIISIVKTVASGDVAVTTIAGTGTKSGFVFLQNPVISASGPTTFAMGRKVILYVQPSSGYTYSWSKDGQIIPNQTKYYLDVDQAGSYQANVFIGFLKVSSNIIQTKTLLDIAGINFKLKITDKSCKSTNNGSISITTGIVNEYIAALKGSGIDTSYSFSASKNISGLKAGNYNLCITVKGSPEFSRCFDVVISEPKELALTSQLNREKHTVSLFLRGADVYYFTLNGKNYQTSESNFELPIMKGKNDFQLWTDLPCQGTINRVFASEAITQIYPQPFEKELIIVSGKIESALISILSPDGRSVYSASHKSINGQYSLAVPDMSPGIYLLKLVYSDTIETFKIIKK